MNTLHVEIITPEMSVLPRKIASVEVEAAEGRLTVLAGHAPLVCSLREGKTRLHLEDHSTEIWLTGDGTLTVAGNAAVLLVKSATKAHSQASPSGRPSSVP